MLEMESIKTLLRVGVLLVLVVPLSGCSDFWCWPFDCSASKSSSGVEDSTSTTSTTTAPTDGGPPALDFNKNVVWLEGAVVADWPETHKLTVSFPQDWFICLNWGGTDTWPSAEIMHTSGTKTIKVNANPWVFVWHDNKWYGSTWEWLAPGNPCKAASAVAGDHIKKNPLKDWDGAEGEVVYFMVSSVIRHNNNRTNYQARTDAVRIVLPKDYD